MRMKKRKRPVESFGSFFFLHFAFRLGLQSFDEGFFSFLFSHLLLIGVFASFHLGHSSIDLGFQHLSLSLSLSFSRSWLLRISSPTV